MTREEFAPLWAELLAAWPAAKPAPGAATLYHRKLEGFTAVEVRTVVDELLVSSEFFPSLAALWQRCLAIRDDAPGWEQAWNEANNAAEHRTSSTPNAAPWVYSHEAVHEALDIIGPWELKTSENHAATRAQFRDIYRSILERRRAAYAIGAQALPAPKNRRLQLAPPS
jgi:hypothetical protein